MRARARVCVCDSTCVPPLHLTLSHPLPPSRQVWTDSRTVNTIARACLSGTGKIALGAVHFFLGIDQRIESDEQEDMEEMGDTMQGAKKAKREAEMMNSHSKKTRARQRKRNTAIRQAGKLNKESHRKAPTPRFPAMQMLNDPQELAERLFARKLRQVRESE